MSVLRRRARAPGELLSTSRTAEAPSAPTRRARALAVFLILCAAYCATRVYSFLPNSVASTVEPPPQVLRLSTAPDDEAALSARRLPWEDARPPRFRESALVCMPTVARRGVEYVTNSIKSFRLATLNSTSLRRLIVYNMDHPPAHPPWLRALFPRGGAPAPARLPSWLDVRPRRARPAQPRKATLGDPVARVRWRSKEALDYAEVLERCAAATRAQWVIVVQDDVLFRHSITAVVDWASEHVVDAASVVNGRRVARVCSASLFDIPAHPRPNDADELRSSNMVARVWRTADAPAWAAFFTDSFDDAPVDWLADRRCRARRGWVPVMWPNPVRHRGSVSSFPENRREGLLT